MNALVRFDREAWGAEYGRGPEHHGVRDLAVIHHFWKPDIPCGETLETERATMRGVERFHVRVREFGRIAYHQVVFPTGHVYEGIGWSHIGAHVGGHNTRSYGIALAIDGEKHEATPAAIEAVQELLREAMRGLLSPVFELGGHRDFAPRGCPGDLVYRQLPEFDPRRDRATDPELRPVLGKGDTGPAVAELQRRLQEALEIPVEDDGIFGKDTQAAVVAFQLEHNLEPDGVAGPATWGVLLP